MGPMLRDRQRHSGFKLRHYLQFSDIGDYVDFVGCTPRCEPSDFLGALYARFPGIPAGSSQDYRVEFIATKIGAAQWSVCIYDDTDQVWCGDGTTVIR